MWRIVRTGDGYVREHVDGPIETLREAKVLVREYRISDPHGRYEVIAWRRRRDD